MQKVFNADILMENADNFVRAEHITNIVPNNPYYVVHSIYFAESLTVFEDAMQKKRLILNVDYEYASMDSVASELSNKDCYRALIFLKDIPQAYIDYHSYGDLVSAELLNDLNDMTEKVKQQTEILTQKVVSLTDELNTHRNDTAPHGAQESAIPRALALRSASGTLQAAEATDEKELTTLGQTLRSIKAAKEALILALKKTKEETLEIVAQLFTRLIDNAPEDLNTLKKLATLASENKQHIASHQLILASRMPLNPVAAYDMADVLNKKKELYAVSNPIVGIKNVSIIDAQKIHEAHKKGTFYHIHSEMSYTGNAKPVVIVYREDWKAIPLWEYCNGTQDFYVFIEKQNFNFLIGVWMNGFVGYEVQPADSVNVYKFTVTELQNSILIDSSGNGNHAIVSGNVMQVKDVAVGAALSFTKGSLSRAPLDCIGVGKKWSHSRWIYVNAQKDKNKELYLWVYSDYDYCYTNMVKDDGIVSTLYVTTAREGGEKNTITVPVPDHWLHLVVMTDLQETSCRKIVYANGKKIDDKTITGNFKGWLGDNEHTDMWYRDRWVLVSLANQLFFDRHLTEAEILWLGRNPYYPVKRYSLAEYKADENRRLIEALQQNTSLFVPKSAFELSGTTLSIKM